MILHTDIETFSELSLRDVGLYKYAADPSFEILMVAYAIDDDEIECYAWDDLPDIFFEYLMDSEIIKMAHNATFERVCFREMGYDVPVEQWRCMMIYAYYCGLPGSLESVSKVLRLGAYGKMTTGKALIRFFCSPVKATKVNNGRTRNLPDDDPVRWKEFKLYCIGDVRAEREEFERLKHIRIPRSVWRGYYLDQHINDLGVRLDLKFIRRVIRVDIQNTTELKARAKEVSQLDNPNSLPQLKRWITSRTGIEIKSLDKDALQTLLDAVEDSAVREVLLIRQQLAKTSISKYGRMVQYAMEDSTARGTLQYYGANRTARWAGRGIQLHNMKKNKMKDLDAARGLVRSGDFELFKMAYQISNTLSELIRTALIPRPGYKLAPVDFSAIEARVIAWLAGETWRLEVFRTHGKIYEASASKMFKIPLEEITEDSEWRAKGKVAELALGFQGALGALKKMGGEKEGLTDEEMEDIVDKWRAESPAIVKMWTEFNRCAKNAVGNRRGYVHKGTGIIFTGYKDSLRVKLPSGRELCYWGAHLAPNKFGSTSVRYWGLNDKNVWSKIDTYGGKLTENIVQAIARDLLLDAMHRAHDAGVIIPVHVHDEVVCELREESAEKEMREIEQLMSIAPAWAEGLPLKAVGHVCDFYKKV